MYLLEDIASHSLKYVHVRFPQLDYAQINTCTYTVVMYYEYMCICSSRRYKNLSYFLTACGKLESSGNILFLRATNGTKFKSISLF